MGDMADWTIENGMLSDLEDEGLFEFGGRLQCKHCGEDSLHWEKTLEGKWRLADDDLVVHSCSEWKPSGAVLP